MLWTGMRMSNSWNEKSYCNNSIHKGRRFSLPASFCFLCYLKKYGEKFTMAMQNDNQILSLAELPVGSKATIVGIAPESRGRKKFDFFSKLQMQNGAAPQPHPF